MREPTDLTLCVCAVDVCRLHRQLLHQLLRQAPPEGGTEAPQDDPHPGERVVV